MSYNSQNQGFKTADWGERSSETEHCRCCGAPLSEGDGCYEKDGKPYCEDCLEAASLDDLVRISEVEAEELLFSIGIRHTYIEARG